MDKFINTVRAVIMFSLLLFVLIFCFQNRQEVDIKFLSMQISQLPLFIALIGILATGLLIGFLAGIIKGSKTRRENKREAQRQETVSKRIEETRKIDSERNNNTTA